jgi:polar amino acid transport system substrate-binding protein
VRKRSVVLCLLLAIALALMVTACGSSESITSLDQLAGKNFAVPTGTVADELVTSKFADAKFTYFDSALECCLAVKDGKADAAAYDLPILLNIAAKNEGLTVLPDMITVDDYGIAMALDNTELKAAIDTVVDRLKSDGTYDEMVARWLPKTGSPAAMPEIALDGTNGVLKLATAPVTEPFSFVDGNQKVVGFDIELATYVAQELGKSLEIVSMDFVEMLPAVVAGEVDMAAACITITAERSTKVLFSKPYYQGGIAALVKK